MLMGLFVSKMRLEAEHGLLFIFFSFSLQISKIFSPGMLFRVKLLHQRKISFNLKTHQAGICTAIICVNAYVAFSVLACDAFSVFAGCPTDQL